MNFKLAIESADGKFVRQLSHNSKGEDAEKIVEFDIDAAFDAEDKIKNALTKLKTEVCKFPVEKPRVEILQSDQHDKTSWHVRFLVSYVPRH